MSSESTESYTVAQIRAAYRQHGFTDDWGLRSFYETGIIAALRGEYDEKDKDDD